MSTPTSATDRRGFTLVELMMVVMVIGIVSAIVFVKLDSVVPGARLRSAATMVIGAAETARSEARLKQVTVTLTYDMEKDKLSLSEPVPPAPAVADTGIVDPAGAAGKETGTPAAASADTASDKRAPLPGEVVVLSNDALPAGIRIDAIYWGESGVTHMQSQAVDFRPSGAVGEHMVVLKESSGGTISVFVPALSGSAFVVDKGLTYGQVRASRRLK